MNNVHPYLFLLLALARESAGLRTQLPKPASLISGRAPVVIEEFGYLVSLQSVDGEGKFDHFCGGGIIGENHILTAAHCVIEDGNEFKMTPILVVAGASDLKNETDENRIAVGVEKIYVPNEYNDSDWQDAMPVGDIAVLKLNGTLNIPAHPRLRKLQLPRRYGRRRHFRNYEDEDASIAGYGWDRVRVKVKTERSGDKTEHEVGSSTDKLYAARTKVLRNDECQQYYTSPIRKGDLCARVVEHEDERPQGVCRGDSGGPLVYKSSTIIGVVSGISIGCNENNEPGVYCRVSSYVDFVRNAMKDVTDNMRTKEY